MSLRPKILDEIRALAVEQEISLPPLTDELRATLKEQQEADDECKQLEEQKKEAADFAERALKEKQQSSDTSDARPTGIWPVITEQQQQEQEARSLELWNQIVSKTSDTDSMTD